ncbi:regulatory protein RecX [Corynebacterium sp. sy039]|uniref:regulatory protein RecX n=1 Tax=Corynebacterium sp. sy039 TaxID=2599641 RepID=UPI0011B6C2CE|nr:regulatory protein RecX [Corynebacterium sp. sy039]QDZ42772.1 regulatory protein RecX [Corynebacterium sp. sy039]
MNSRDNRLAHIEKLRQMIAEYNAQPQSVCEEETAQKTQARRRALLLIEQRQRSHYELEQKLCSLGFAPEIIASLLEDFVQSKLIDDKNFAYEWVRQRHQMRGKSKYVLGRELKEKGIDAALRQEALSQIDENTEHETAKKIAAKKAEKITDIPVNNAQYIKNMRSIMGMLARRGFSYSISHTMAQQALEERIEELKESSARA